MRYKILIIVNTFLYEFVQTTLSDIQTDCDIRIINYDNFKQIPVIYENNRDWADGVLVNGLIAHAALKKAYPNHPVPFLFFDPTLTGLYRQLIDLFVIRKELDTRRVILDFLLPLYDDPTVDYFLEQLEISKLTKTINAWIADATFSHFPLLFEQIIEKTMELWTSGKIDLVICTYGSIVPKLQKRGVACEYIPPEDFQLRSLFTDLQEQIQLKHMIDNLPAVIAVSYMNRDCSFASMRTLQRALNELKQECTTNYIIQETPERYYLYTSLKTVSQLTRQYQHCFFQAALEHSYQIHAAVGYGIGKDVPMAKLHADIAIKEALLSNGSFLADENQNLLGPLNSEQTLRISPHISENVSNIARKCNLSPLTVQKVISVTRQTDSDLITAQALSEHLGTTVRNANRILTCLQKGGCASVTHTQPASTRGRPVKMYKLLIEI